MRTNYLIGLFAILSLGVLDYAFISCTSSKARCTPTFYNADQTSYSVSATLVTPKNVWVDTSGQNISLLRVDRLTDETEACLVKTFGNPPVIPLAVAQAAGCKGLTFPLPIPRQCLTVKFPSDWKVSQTEFAGSKQQILSVGNGDPNCTEKGLPPGYCFYRAAIQDGLTIVTTPSMYVYKDPLVRIVTGCQTPWSSPQFAACMAPTVGALDDGTAP
jgi:hypothetical protein